MQDKVYLISFVGDNVFQGKSIIGFISEFDTELIARIVKERSNLTLGEKYPAKFTFETGVHWEFATDRDTVDVHVDVVYHL